VNEHRARRNATAEQPSSRGSKAAEAPSLGDQIFELRLTGYYTIERATMYDTKEVLDYAHEVV